MVNAKEGLKYHLSPDGIGRECEAHIYDCRYGKHYPTKIAAEQAHKEKLIAELLCESPPPTSPASARVKQALESNLAYTGPKPKWWEEYAKAQENHPVLPQTPELLDVISSPVGDIAVVWKPQEQSDKMIMNSGYDLNVLEYLHLETQESLGYIKLASQSKESLARSFGDDEFFVYRYLSRYGNHNIPEDETGIYGLRDIKEEEAAELRRKLWYREASSGRWQVEYDGKTYTGGWDLREEMIPDDDKRIKADLAKQAKKHEKRIMEKQEYFAVPFVDFSRISKPELQGSGFGAALYIYAARRLAKDDKYLRGSGIQSKDAEALWERFRDKFPSKVGIMTLTMNGVPQEHPIMDFREK